MPSQLPEYLRPIKVDADGNLFYAQDYVDNHFEYVPYEYYVDGKRINKKVLDDLYERNEWGAYRLRNPYGKYGCHIKVCRHFYNRAELLKLVETELASRERELTNSNYHNQYIVNNSQRIIDNNKKLLALLG